MKKALAVLLSMVLVSCAPIATPVAVPATSTPTALPSFTPVPSQTATITPTVTPTFTSTVTDTPTASPVPFVESLPAAVSSDLLSCRYGPGPEYLFLFAFRKNAAIVLNGRADGNNWVLVENGAQDCWVNLKYVEVRGDVQTLKNVYPAGYTLPVSPYYGPTTVLGAERTGDEITVRWVEIPVSPGKYEDAEMFPYIIEVWRCENGALVFDALGARAPVITFVDQAGCSVPSHGRVYVQEKHGYAGPAEIPWPPR